MSSRLPDPWPFDQPSNCAVLTTTHVMRENAPIVYVSHDEDDHGWQFHGAQPAQMKYAMLVALKEVIAIDFTVCEIADIPPGWIAHRKSAGDEWIREEKSR